MATGKGRGRKKKVIRRQRFLPNDLVEEILQRLPVNSLIRFQCASKTWQSIIFSPTFITKHLLHQKQNKVKVNYLHPCSSDYSAHVSLIDNGSMTSTIVSHCPNQYLVIVATCNGLVCIRFLWLCLVESYNNEDWWCFKIWNPATRKLKLLPTPQFAFSNHGYMLCNTIHGFSYIPRTSTYKLVQILLFNKQGDDVGFIARVEVLNVGENCWREVVCPGQAETFNELTNCLIGQDFLLGEYSSNRPIVVHSCLHWLGTLRNKGLSMLTFDLEEQVFRQTTMPPHSDDGFSLNRGLAVFEDNLALFESLKWGTHFQVWIYDGMSHSWTKRFTFGPLPMGDYPIGFWEDRDIIIKHNQIYPGGKFAYLYNPNTKKKMSRLCMERDCNLAFYPHVESLVQI